MNQHLLMYISLLIKTTCSRNALNFSKLCDQKLSHDSISRFLYQFIDWRFLLYRLINIGKKRKGYFIIDDTVIEKPYSSKLEGASWVYSSKHKKVIFGYHLVVLAWTDGAKKFVIDCRLYEKGGLSKIKLALEMLSYARNKLRLKPEFVLFDSWYSSSTLMKRIKDYGWYFICRVKNNRKFDGKRIKHYLTNPYWMLKGSFSCGLRALVVRNGTEYYATNLMRLSKSDLFEIYRKRQMIEEINKLLKFCGLNDCQARGFKAQSKHVHCVIIAFSLLQLESLRTGRSIYSLKKDHRLSAMVLESPSFKRLKRAA